LHELGKEIKHRIAEGGMLRKTIIVSVCLATVADAFSPALLGLSSSSFSKV
jgi:hypothetical protein